MPACFRTAQNGAPKATWSKQAWWPRLRCSARSDVCTAARRSSNQSFAAAPPCSFRTDLTAFPPDFFVCVPLVLDTLHSKVRPLCLKGVRKVQTPSPALHRPSRPQTRAAPAPPLCAPAWLATNRRRHRAGVEWLRHTCATTLHARAYPDAGALLLCAAPPDPALTRQPPPRSRRAFRL